MHALARCLNGGAWWLVFSLSADTAEQHCRLQPCRAGQCLAPDFEPARDDSPAELRPAV